MNREDIIRMAQEAHFNSKTWIDIYKDEITAGDVKGYLEAFAALVASAEREACAKLLEEAAQAAKNADPQGFVWIAIKTSAEGIRAKGKA